MQHTGFEQIYQLDGGILKYFEECGGEHYNGECFVFDQRVGVEPTLDESDTSQCYACQAPLSPEERQDERFVEGRSCPHCFISTEQQSALTIAQRQATLLRITNPLPGAAPYENQRPLNVPGRFDGWTVLDFLCGILGHIPREQWRRTCAEGRIRKRAASTLRGNLPDDKSTGAAFDDVVRAGERYVHVQQSMAEPDVNVDIRILHEDEAVIVVHKPAPLPMHPSGRFNRNTLQFILCELYKPQSPRPAHRLDANTTGLVLFARTRHYARQLQRQFEEAGSAGIEKQYLARVQGHPVAEEFECRIPISDVPGPAGSRTTDPTNGLAAHTEFRVLKRFADGTSLLEAIPRTGRTNQIRVHLWHLNHPICDDPTYLSNGQLGGSQTASLDASPMCLLAQRIAFTHPITGQRMSFEADPQEWCSIAEP